MDIINSTVNDEVYFVADSLKAKNRFRLPWKSIKIL
jgi:hypothetical protein